VGRRWFSLQSIDEQNEIGRLLKESDVFIHSYLPGFESPWPWLRRLSCRCFMDSAFECFGAHFAELRCPSVALSWRECSGVRRLALTAEIVYDRQREYWIHGLVVATVARLVAEDRGVPPGVHFLSDAVDPITCMAELRKGGVEPSARLEFLE
jgi:hypothetical protein